MSAVSTRVANHRRRITSWLVALVACFLFGARTEGAHIYSFLLFRTSPDGVPGSENLVYTIDTSTPTPTIQPISDRIALALAMADVDGVYANSLTFGNDQRDQEHPHGACLIGFRAGYPSGFVPLSDPYNEPVGDLASDFFAVPNAPNTSHLPAFAPKVIEGNSAILPINNFALPLPQNQLYLTDSVTGLPHDLTGQSDIIGFDLHSGIGNFPIYVTFDALFDYAGETFYPSDIIRIDPDLTMSIRLSHDDLGLGIDDRIDALSGNEFNSVLQGQPRNYTFSLDVQSASVVNGTYRACELLEWREGLGARLFRSAESNCCAGPGTVPGPDIDSVVSIDPRVRKFVESLETIPGDGVFAQISSEAEQVTALVDFSPTPLDENGRFVGLPALTPGEWRVVDTYAILDGQAVRDTRFSSEPGDFGSPIETIDATVISRHRVQVDVVSTHAPGDLGDTWSIDFAGVQMTLPISKLSFTISTSNPLEPGTLTIAIRAHDSSTGLYSEGAFQPVFIAAEAQGPFDMAAGPDGNGDLAITWQRITDPDQDPAPSVELRIRNAANDVLVDQTEVTSPFTISVPPGFYFCELRNKPGGGHDSFVQRMVAFMPFARAGVELRAPREFASAVTGVTYVPASPPYLGVISGATLYGIDVTLFDAVSVVGPVPSYASKPMTAVTYVEDTSGTGWLVWAIAESTTSTVLVQTTDLQLQPAILPGQSFAGPFPLSTSAGMLNGTVGSLDFDSDVGLFRIVVDDQVYEFTMTGASPIATPLTPAVVTPCASAFTNGVFETPGSLDGLSLTHSIARDATGSVQESLALDLIDPVLMSDIASQTFSRLGAAALPMLYVSEGNRVHEIRSRERLWGTSGFDPFLGGAVYHRDIPTTIDATSGPQSVSTVIPLEISDATRIDDMRVTIVLDHPDYEALSLDLESPLGTSVALLGQSYGSGTTELVFARPGAGDELPASFDTFDHLLATGTWRLIVENRGSETGTLQSLTIRIDVDDAQVEFIAGDVDGNGTIAIGDITKLAELLSGDADSADIDCLATADVNQNGEIDGNDVYTLKVLVFDDDAVQPTCAPHPLGDTLTCVGYGHCP